MAGQIIYKDISPTAAADATYTGSGQTDFSTLDMNADDESERSVTLGLNRWALDGSFVLLDGNVHFWSEALSDENCEFETAPKISVSFAQRHSSVGVTLQFDTAVGEWCSEVTIKWTQGATVLATQTFEPNASTYFCQRNVEAWDGIEITFVKTSLPYRRAKVSSIMFGIIRAFGMDEIRSASAVNEMDLLSAELPASQLNWTLDSKADIDFMFQLKQPVELRDGNTLLGVYYINLSNRVSRSIYQITAQDAVGVLGEQFFGGGAYLSGISAKTLFTTIVGGAFEIDFGTVADATLYGVLVAQTKREALQQVLFAWGKCLRTDGGYTLKVFDPPSVPAEITAAETYNGVSIETAPITTEVVVYGHTYTRSDDGDVEVLGLKYADVVTAYTVTNPNVTAETKANVVEVDAATLVSTRNGAAVAQRVYNHYTRRNTHKSKILYNGQHLGDCVEQPTPWDTSEIGNIRAVTITLSGIIAADIESLGVEA